MTNILKTKIRSFFFAPSWFWMAIAILLATSLALRFWELGRFNQLVFDEVYYVKYAQNYLSRTPFFDVHPPLGKYLIAFGIWVSKLHFWNPTGQTTAFGYRWLNALTGSLILLIVAGIAYQLSYRRSYAFIAAWFACADGLLLVESRYAFLNIYLVFFGLLAQWCFLIALAQKSLLRWLYLVLAGIFFGCSAAVKWYGLGFWLGIGAVWASARIVSWWQRDRKLSFNQPFWQNLSKFKLWPLLVFLGVIPVVVYCLLWIPHWQLDRDRGFWELHQKSWTFHQQLGSSSQIHPYCSPWYSWVLMVRPVAYFFEKSGNSAQSTVYDVHGMGNPILWWLGTIAMLILVGKIAQQVYPIQKKRQREFDFSIPLYLLLNYGANWLPWMLVHRCAFLYYYMPASIFGFLAIAYLVDRWLYSDNLWWRAIAINIIFFILMGLAYWLPIYLGLPLSREAFDHRMWFRSWY
ncbi:dolichyl-phosphate-mannose--protein mannosyltransferase [Pleurocapsa sp. PCC 7327]|uniref:dolichyl-phosphate-mannose--protein mannosyltransferase n=1 Tax=Pleurocapsa sp. PCC 7327 TaxID=118163 RepID=UPI00059E2616|nr:phospholipid carrier-dependent glycosyltransferase [Pleurocapsa sp. PCC 7327]